MWQTHWLELSINLVGDYCYCLNSLLTRVSCVLQEKKLNILSLATGKPVRCFKPDCDAGEPIKVGGI